MSLESVTSHSRAGTGQCQNIRVHCCEADLVWNCAKLARSSAWTTVPVYNDPGMKVRVVMENLNAEPPASRSLQRSCPSIFHSDSLAVHEPTRPKLQTSIFLCAWAFAFFAKPAGIFPLNVHLVATSGRLLH